MQETIVTSLAGGALIGVSTALFLVFNGRVTGISGIVNGLFNVTKSDYAWRVLFVVGLLLGGAFMATLQPELFYNTTGRSLLVILIAGLLVGFGTVMGSGCTSGHGICGVARLSPRSLAATVAFMLAGMLMANVLRWVVGV